ncbi:MAG TPA: D-alanine--D-alanine ligase family protein [Actinomycetota bacterium]
MTFEPVELSRRCRQLGRPEPGGGAGSKRRLAVVFGGRSAEHEISVASARSVLEALDPERYEVLPIGIDKEGRWHQLSTLPGAPHRGELPAVGRDEGTTVALSREPDDAALVADDGTRHDIDVVFPVMHGPYGEDGSIQGMLELAGIPYVGAGVLASAVGLDKAVQKVLFEAAGLRVVPHEVVHEREWEEDRDAVEARAAGLGLPVFVKPATLGSSVGITKVKRIEDFVPAMEEALSHARKALVERSMEGAREIECAVLGNDDPVASVAAEIVPAGEFYDYRAKYLDEDALLQVPADLPPSVTEEVQRMAVVAFQAIDCAGMARVDFFYRQPDEILVNEINTIPGFTAISMYPKMWAASGLSYPDLIDRLVDLAVERHNKERKRGHPLSG